MAGRRAVSRRSRNPRRKTQNWSSLAGKAFKLATRVARLINTEHKFLDTNVTSLAVFNAGYGVDLLTGVAQGVDMNQRTGNSIKLSSWELEGFLAAGTIPVTTPIKFRIWLVRDTEQAGAVPNPNQLFVNTAASDLSVDTFRQIQTQPTSRWQVLMDERITLDPGRAESQSLSFRKSLNSHVHYIGTTGAAASMGPGTLYLFYTSTGALAGNGCVLTYNSRIRYVDN